MPPRCERGALPRPIPRPLPTSGHHRGPLRAVSPPSPTVSEIALDQPGRGLRPGSAWSGRSACGTEGLRPGSPGPAGCAVAPRWSRSLRRRRQRGRRRPRRGSPGVCRRSRVRHGLGPPISMGKIPILSRRSPGPGSVFNPNGATSVLAKRHQPTGPRRLPGQHRTRGGGRVQVAPGHGHAIGVDEVRPDQNLADAGRGLDGEHLGHWLILHREEAEGVSVNGQSFTRRASRISGHRRCAAASRAGVGQRRAAVRASGDRLGRSRARSRQSLPGMFSPHASLSAWKKPMARLRDRDHAHRRRRISRRMQHLQSRADAGAGLHPAARRRLSMRPISASCATIRADSCRPCTPGRSPAARWRRVTTGPEGRTSDRDRRVRPLDGVYLAMHGAMFVEGIEDAEGDLIAAVRGASGPTQDRRQLRPARQRHPHGGRRHRHPLRLPHRTAHRRRSHHAPVGRHAGLGAGRAASPFVVWQPVPVLLPGERTSTVDQPAQGLYASLAAIERGGDLGCLADGRLRLGRRAPRHRRRRDHWHGPRRDRGRGGGPGHAYWDAREDFAFGYPTGTSPSASTPRSPATGGRS